MTRRPIAAIAVCAVLWAWCSGFAGLVPCDYQAAAIAQEPPAPDPQPAPEVTADIVAPEVAEPGTFVSIGLKTNGTKINVRWLFDGKADPAHFRPVNGRSAVVTALAGEHTVAIFGVIDETPVLVQRTVTFGEPEPPEPPKPLSELVGADAAKIAADYRALAELADTFTSAAHFWANHDALLTVDKVTLSKAAREAIEKRLAVADPLDTKALAANLVSVADELAKPGPTPPPPVGKRAVVILRETEDNTPAIGLLTTQLRTGEVDAYLKAKGHTLDILDDDNPAPIVSKLTALGVTEPALFILDAATGIVVHQQPLPTSAAEVLAVLKANGG